uniref:Ubiquitin-conjugating enzyme E2 J1 n=2 Tax=Schistocephalus solidus TaxID=70667 RepID=A0A0V0J7I3_SCHSO
MTTYNTRSPAVKRLMREAQELRQPTEFYYAQPLEDNLFEWHFTIRGQEDSDFAGGIYHGRIYFPTEYPLKPPNIILLTPNGRFETYRQICLSISGYHPETWRPSWSIRTVLLAIIGFMPTSGAGAIGALDMPSEERRKLAASSLNFTCDVCGPTKDLLLPLTSASTDLSKEASEVASQLTFRDPEVTTSEAADSTTGPTTEQSVDDASPPTNPVSSSMDLPTLLPPTNSPQTSFTEAPTSVPSNFPQPLYWICYPVYGFSSPTTLPTSQGSSTSQTTTIAPDTGGPLSFEEWLKRVRSNTPSEAGPSNEVQASRPSTASVNVSQDTQLTSTSECVPDTTKPSDKDAQLFLHAESTTPDAQSQGSGATVPPSEVNSRPVTPAVSALPTKTTAVVKTDHLDVVHPLAPTISTATSAKPPPSPKTSHMKPLNLHEGSCQAQNRPSILKNTELGPHQRDTAIEHPAAVALPTPVVSGGVTPSAHPGSAVNGGIGHNIAKPRSVSPVAKETTAELSAQSSPQQASAIVTDKTKVIPLPISPETRPHPASTPTSTKKYPDPSNTGLQPPTPPPSPSAAEAATEDRADAIPTILEPETRHRGGGSSSSSGAHHQPQPSTSAHTPSPQPATPPTITNTTAPTKLPSSKEIAQKILKEAAAKHHQRVCGSQSSSMQPRSRTVRSSANRAFQTARLAALAISFLLITLICRRLMLMVF